MEHQKSYICIDLKSFYASVECVERGLDPFTTNLVVADPTRSQSTICLAITPAMKKLGVKNRCRIHEIPTDIEYITAMPRMQLYMDYSAKIYSIYLRYISKEDIHVYSIDECFMDVTDYLTLYDMTAKEMAVTLMDGHIRYLQFCRYCVKCRFCTLHFGADFLILILEMITGIITMLLNIDYGFCHLL